MKKLFLLLICSAFSVIINAQNFIVVNSTNATIDVTPGKFYTVCNTAPDCTMNNMNNIAAWSTVSQGYPALCTNKNIMIFVNIPAYNPGWGGWGNFSWCGTDLYNQPMGNPPGGEVYNLVATGGGDVTLTIHY